MTTLTEDDLFYLKDNMHLVPESGELSEYLESLNEATKFECPSPEKLKKMAGEYSGHNKSVLSKVIQPTSGEDSGQISGPCQTCGGGKPCRCITKIKVTDKYEVKDGKFINRELIYDVDGTENKNTNMYVIAKKPVLEGVENILIVDVAGGGCINRNQELGSVKISEDYSQQRTVLVGESKEVSVKNFFVIPTFMTLLFPQQVCYLLYVIGLIFSRNVSSNAADLRIISDHCIDNKVSLGVKSVPYFKVSGNVAGKVTRNMPYAGEGNTSCNLSGSIEGKFGSQTINWTKTVGETTYNRQQNSSHRGERSRLTDILFKIYEALNNLKDNSSRSRRSSITRNTTQNVNFEGNPDDAPTSSINFSFGVSINAGSIELKANEKIDRLLIDYKKISVAFFINVSGKLDLVEVLLNRVPGMEDKIREVREEAANKSNPAYIELKCNLGLSSLGEIKFNVNDDKVIDVFVEEGSEENGSDLNIEGSVKITGLFELSVTAGVNKWYLKGGVEASATMHTAYYIRVRRNPGETSVFQYNSFFEGLKGKIGYQVYAGAEEDNGEASPLDMGIPNDEQVTYERKRDKLVNKTVIHESELRRTLIDPIGSKDDWQDF